MHSMTLFNTHMMKRLTTTNNFSYLQNLHGLFFGCKQTLWLFTSFYCEWKPWTQV